MRDEVDGRVDGRPAHGMDGGRRADAGGGAPPGGGAVAPAVRPGRHAHQALRAPCVEGAGVHHNPTPGPAGHAFVHGHVWVTLAWVARRPPWGSIALPPRASLYVRQKDVPRLPPEYGWSFRTKLTLAAELVRWLAAWLGRRGVRLWLAIDGAHARREAPRAARRLVHSRRRVGCPADAIKRAVALSRGSARPRSCEACCTTGDGSRVLYQIFGAKYWPKRGLFRGFRRDVKPCGGCRNEKTQPFDWRGSSSGAEGDRTPNLYIANVALSQLSYGPGRAALRWRNYRGRSRRSQALLVPTRTTSHKGGRKC